MRKIIGAIVAASLTFSLLPAYAQQNDTVSGPATQVDSRQSVIQARNAYPTSIEIKAPAGTNVLINNQITFQSIAIIASATGEWQKVTYAEQPVGTKLYALDPKGTSTTATIDVVAAPPKPTTTTPTATKTTTPTPTKTTTPTPTKTTSSKATSTPTTKATATSEPKPKQTSAATTTPQAPKPTTGVTPDKTAGHSTASFIGSIIAVIVAAVGILAAVFQKQLLSLVRR
ncbi:hypothetical protein [Corynebacterium sp. HS2168-gen11]|uniref:hypothetical protein n=1 Tax=Corynebacterium sp. HS2168-gen11 TaxID=2974027 RepID=UPI00216AF409|nr:hypothetical protein [Corynebacterium sp. HS2168-gen11]MCS4536071.1 hypothetical protein [Corynebacterium sp. HS2168-gen11]